MSIRLRFSSGTTNTNQEPSMAVSGDRLSTYTSTSTGLDHERPKSGDSSRRNMWSSMLDGVASGKRLPEKNILVLG